MDPEGDVGNLKDLLNLTWTFPTTKRLAYDETLFSDSKENNVDIENKTESYKKVSEKGMSEVFGVHENPSEIEICESNGNEENNLEDKVFHYNLRTYINSSCKTEINYQESDLSGFLSTKDPDWENRYAKKKTNVRKKNKSGKKFIQRKYNSEPFPMRYNLRGRSRADSRCPSVHCSSVETGLHWNENTTNKETKSIRKKFRTTKNICKKKFASEPFNMNYEIRESKLMDSMNARSNFNLIPSDLTYSQKDANDYTPKDEDRRNGQDNLKYHSNELKLKVKYRNSCKSVKSSSKYKEIERKLKIKHFFLEISSTINKVEDMLSDWKYSSKLPNLKEASKLLKKLYEINFLLKDEYSGIQFKRDQLDILENILDFLKKIEDLQSTLKKRIKKLNKMKFVRQKGEENSDVFKNQNSLNYEHATIVEDVNNRKDDSVKELWKTMSESNNCGEKLVNSTLSIQSNNISFTGPGNGEMFSFEMKEPSQFETHAISFLNSLQKDIEQPSMTCTSLAEVVDNGDTGVREQLNKIGDSPTISIQCTRNLTKDMSSVSSMEVTDEPKTKSSNSIKITNFKVYRKPLLQSKSIPLNIVNANKNNKDISGEVVSYGAKEILSSSENIKRFVMGKNLSVLDIFNTTPNQVKESSENNLIIFSNNKHCLDASNNKSDIVKLTSTANIEAKEPPTKTSFTEASTSNRCSNFEQQLKILPPKEIECFEIETYIHGAINEKHCANVSNSPSGIIVNSLDNNNKITGSRSEIDISHDLPLNLLNSFEKMDVTNRENCIDDGCNGLLTSLSTNTNHNSNRQKETTEIYPLGLSVYQTNCNKNHFINNFSMVESTHYLGAKTNCHSSFGKENKSSKSCLNNEKLSPILTSDCEEIVQNNMQKQCSNSENIDLGDIIHFNVNTEDFLQPFSLDFTEQSKLNPSTFQKECFPSNIVSNSLLYTSFDEDHSTKNSNKKTAKIPSKQKTTSDFQTEKTIIHSNDKKRLYENVEKLIYEDSSKKSMPSSGCVSKLPNQMLPSSKVSLDYCKNKTLLANINAPMSTKNPFPMQQKLSTDHIMSEKNNSFQDQSKPLKKVSKPSFQSTSTENPLKNIKYLRIISESELIDPEDDDDFMLPSNYVW